jgi:hypothetical protein
MQITRSRSLELAAYLANLAQVEGPGR